MPVIHEYKSQVLENGQLNVRTDPAAAGATGRAAAQLGGTMFEAGLEMVESKDRSDLQAQIAQQRADATIGLKKAIESGEVNDDAFLEKFNTRLSQDFEAIGAGARTRAGRDTASAHRAVLLGDFSERAYTAKATADGQQVALNLDRALNSSGTVLTEDPTQYQGLSTDFTLAFNDPAGPYAKLSAGDRAKLKQEVDQKLAKWYVQGAIEKLGPEFARKELESGKLNNVLSAEDKVMLLARAETEKRTRQDDTHRERTILKQQQADADDKREMSMLQRLDEDMSKWPSFKEISHAFNDPDKVKNMRATLQTRLDNPYQTTNTAVFLDTQKKIYLPPNDPGRITDPAAVTTLYAVNNQLNHKDMISLLRDMEVAKSQDPLGPDLQTATEKVKRSLTGSMPFMPEQATAATYRWQKDTEAKMKAAAAAGGNQRDVLRDALDPKNVSTFTTTSQAAVSQAAAAAKKVHPGKTAAEYAAVPPGAAYMHKDGSLRVKPMGNTVNVSDAPVPSVPGE